MKPILQERKINFYNDLIIEQPPTYRTIALNTGKRYFLYFPYVIHLIRNNPTYSGHNQKTLHVGFRKEPLTKNKRGIRKSIILFPPFASIYSRWFLVCCAPKVDAFWSTLFDGSPSWADHKLKEELNLTFESWAKMSPDDFMSLLDKWPETVDVGHNSTGLPQIPPYYEEYEGEYSTTTKTKGTIGDMFGKIERSTLNHIGAFE